MKNNRKAGFHVSIAGGVSKAFPQAIERNINAFQIFLKSSNRWFDKPYAQEEIERFKTLAKENSAIEIFSHSAYLINPASPGGEVLAKSQAALNDELARGQLLGVPYLVLHPGSHKGTSEEAGVKQAALTIDYAYEKSESSTMILLETTSGQGDCIGYKFEHLRDIIAQSKYSDKLGVCLDTCHIFSAGYDFSKIESLEKIMNDFGRIIGFARLKLIHLNDSKFAAGTKKDRHEDLGKGEIGLDALRIFVNHKHIIPVSVIMETPVGDDDLASDIANFEVFKKLIEN